MSIFEEAKSEWRTLLTKKKWTSPVFGETYYIKYPLEIGTAEAQTYKQSIFRGDDSVHAWEAKGVRQKIIQRMIESQERTIRPWYGELSFFSDSTKMLPPIPESELDFILRTSLLSTEEGDESQPFFEIRKKLIEYLDPDLDVKSEKKQFFLQSPKDRAMKYGQAIIELYGLLNTIKNRFFVLDESEIREIIDFMLDVNETDKHLVKRFVEINKDDNKPFIGMDNPDIKRKSNFMLKYIGGGSEEFYIKRVFQLWLRNLLDFDDKAKNFLEEKKADFFHEFNDVDLIKKVLYQAIKLHLWISKKERLSSILKANYATKKDFSGYKSDLIHLLTSRKFLFSEISLESELLPIEPSEYDSQYVCHELGVAIVKSIVDYIGKQIPEPEGFDRIQAKLIVRKRFNNLKKYVLTDEIKNKALKPITVVFESIGTETEEEDVENAIREPYNRIVPRSEYYFKEMESEVKDAMEQMGDTDLRKELAQSTDDPQTLVKQYGGSAIDTLGRDYKIEDLYSTILSHKSSEILFSGTSLSPLKKQRVIDSLVTDLFSPQFKFLKLIENKGENRGTE